MNCSLSNLTLPSDGQILYVTDFVEPIFRRHSASHNGSIKIRERIASELEGYMQKEFSGTLAYRGLEVAPWVCVVYVCVVCVGSTCSVLTGNYCRRLISTLKVKAWAATPS